MDTEILNENPVAQTQELFHEDEAAGRVYLELIQDVSEIVEANHALYNLSDGVPRYGDMKRVASIPMVVYTDLQRRGIAQDPAAFKRWLNDPDNRAFRTLPGVL